MVIGAGPTGVELAAELYDLVFEDVAKTFPRRLLEDVSINIIDLQEKILSSYDREMPITPRTFLNEQTLIAF